MKYIPALLCAMLIATQSFSQNLYPYIKNAKWGFCTNKKVVVITPAYNFVKPYNHGLAFVKKDKFWGAINTAGKVVIPIAYANLEFGFNAHVVADSINEGYYGDKANNRIALFDSTGKRIYKARFQSLPKPLGEYYDFEKSFSYLEKGKWGIMDKSYKITVPAKYDAEFWFGKGLAAVKIAGKTGYIDSKGNLVIPARYDNANQFDNWGHAVVKTGTKEGVIDTKGNTVVPIKYTSVHSEQNGFFTVEENEKIGLLNRTGKQVLPCTYSYPVFSFDKQSMPVYRQDEMGKYGFMDTTGKMIIEPQYDGAMSFFRGMGMVQKGRRYFYVNTKNEAVTPDYDFVSTHCLGDTNYIIFKRAQAWGVAGLDGKDLFVLNDVENISTYCNSSTYFSAEKNGKFGVLNLQGQWVIQPKYSNELRYENSLFFEEVGGQGPDGDYYVSDQYYVLPDGTELRD